MNMRKILAVALALLMCVAALPFSVAASGTVPPTLEATYDTATQTVTYSGAGYIKGADLQIFIIHKVGETRTNAGIATGKVGTDRTINGKITQSVLAVGDYELSVHYTTGLGERAQFDEFEVTTPPTITNAPPPTINTQPQNVTVKVGEKADLTVEATTSGAGTLTYQWYKNPTATVPGSGGEIITEATNKAYSAPTATVGVISYYVVVTNTDNSATGSKTATIASNAATVTVAATDEPTPPTSPPATSQPGPDSNSGSSGTSAMAPSPSPRPSATPAATSGITVDGEPSNIVFNEDGSVTLTAEDIENAGGSVLIGIPTAKGGPTYVVVDIDGNIVPLSAFGDGYMYAMLVKAGTYKVVENGKGFNDIDGHWAREYVDFVTARELFLGVGGGAFSPDTSMTRAMFVTVMSRIDGAELSGYEGSRYGDVAAGEWYGQAVEWAADSGIATGVGDGRFDPDAEITREEMAVMLGRYMRYANYDLPDKTGAIVFNDGAEISEWAAFDVEVMQRAGIIVGKPGDLFDPRGIATRAEVATVITRFVEAILAE